MESKRFLILFSIFFIIPYLLIIYNFIPTNDINLFLAQTIHSWLPSQNIYLSGTTIVSETISFLIVPDCSGLVMIAMFFALIAASNGSLKHKLISLALFSPLLFVFNIFRLFLTIATAFNFGKLAFEVMHLSLWIYDSVVVISFWLIALEFIFKKKLIDAIRFH